MNPLAITLAATPLYLLIITFWLARKHIPIGFTAIPMVFMIAVTGWTLKINLVESYTRGNLFLLSIGGIIMLLQGWMVIEGLIVLNCLHKNSRSEGKEPEASANPSSW